jgi:hypothetical protein
MQKSPRTVPIADSEGLQVTIRYSEHRSEALNANILGCAQDNSAGLDDTIALPHLFGGKAQTQSTTCV